MRAFRFSLDRILSLRSHAEREWEIKLAAATRPCIEISAAIELANRRKTSELNRRFGDRLSAEALLFSHRFVARLDHEIVRLTHELSIAEKARQEVERGYLEAHRGRMVLDKLKERRRSEYDKSRLRAEVAETDEIGAAFAASPEVGGSFSG